MHTLHGHTLQAVGGQPPRYASAPCKLTLPSYLFTRWHLFWQMWMVHYELINRTTGIFRHLKQFGHIRCDITLSFKTDSAGRYLFCKLCLPWHSVQYLLPPVRKCNKVRDLYELPDFWPPRALISMQLNYKIWVCSLPEKAQDVNDLRQHLIDMWVGVKQCYWQCHRPVAQTSPCLHSSH